MKRTTFILPWVICFLQPSTGQISSSFEIRYFSREKAAAGITDFKGENEFFDTEQRIEFLDLYADVASKWFLDSAMDQRVNQPGEAERFLSELKKLPLPVHRRRIILDQWKSTGLREEGRKTSSLPTKSWSSEQGVSSENGTLQIKRSNFRVDLPLDTLQWRFNLSWRAMNSKGKVPMEIALLEKGIPVTETGFHSNGNIFFSHTGADRMGETYLPGRWYDFRLEVDLVNDRYNLYVNGKLTADWVPMKKCSFVDGLRISGSDGVEIDDLVGLKFDTTGCDRAHPYSIEAFIQEDFQADLNTEGWYLQDYNDKAWETCNLPAVRGGALEAGEDLLLRKKISVGAIDDAWLNIESLDPGGEVWINGRVIFVTHDRHPVKIEVSEFLKPYSENTIGIRVFSFYNDGPLYHSPRDRNIGWFCGRAWIDLTGEIYINRVNVFTSSLQEKTASQVHKMEIMNRSDRTFKGRVVIDYYPWYPSEGPGKKASFESPIELFAGDSINLFFKGIIHNPVLWTHDAPFLYRIHVKLVEDEKLLDDEMIITGIRTVSQEEGIFRINGNPELLGGSQTMGFRMPIEKQAKWNRCPPPELIADELLAIKKLGNTLRIHVHAGGEYAYSVNDPRVAEMADQLGVMLIWPTGSWIREGEWGGIDFEGYPEYMNQVFNHPSIVIWEGSNHPNHFAGKSLSYSNRFIERIYNTISSTDSSRLISPSSYNLHFAYRNDSGTINEKGDSICPVPEWTAPLIVRGNQDAITGYGAEWHTIRKWPDPYRKDLLESPFRAYFNFEHEESTGMSNPRLARGKPWYELPSYENAYDQGSIGRELKSSEWRISQAWQAFSAWESMKWQRIMDVDGFSWCCLHGGPNSGTYRKPLIDEFGHAKLAFYVNRMALRDIIAGSDNPDVVYSRSDKLNPVVLNVGEKRNVRLKIVIRRPNGEIVDTREFPGISLEKGRTVTRIPSFKPSFPEEGYYVIEYYVLRS